MFLPIVSWVKGATRKERLIELLEPPVQALGYELVDLATHSGGHGLVRVYIDREDGIDLADCELVSRQLSTFLDVEDPLPGQYVLEVSSPGLDRPLRKLEHFRRFQDEQASIRLKAARDGRRKLSGRLAGVEDETILIEVHGETWRLQPTEIESAHLVPRF